LRFNGATSFQTWKFLDGFLPVDQDTQLQWGHVFSDVEMEKHAKQVREKAVLQWGHVFSDVEIL